MFEKRERKKEAKKENNSRIKGQTITLTMEGSYSSLRLTVGK